MSKPSQADLMVLRARKPKERPAPGGPGAMAALRRAQEKLKALGIKPWRPAPPPAPKQKPAAPPAAEPASAAPPRHSATKGRPAAAKKTKAPVRRTATATSVTAARKAPAKPRRR